MNQVTKVFKIIKIIDFFFCNYISGNIFEDEVINYLKSKLDQFCIEIPNVFYTYKKSQTSFFYNEFDSIYKIDNKISLNKGIVRIKYTYNANKSMFNNLEDKDVFEIPEKSLLFVEVKKNQNFEGIFTELFLKINKIKNLINDIYDTYDYKIIILYFYNTSYIKSKDDFINFQNGIRNASTASNYEKYDVYSFYIYDNIYFYNTSENQKKLEKKFNYENEQIKNELAQTKNTLNQTKNTLTQTQNTLTQTQNTLTQTQERLKVLENIISSVLHIDINNEEEMKKIINQNNMNNNDFHNNNNINNNNNHY